MPEPEVIVCDTSLVAVLERASAEPIRLAHWSEDMRARLDRAVLAISVVAEAEMRAGWAYANWGRRRVAAAELRLRAYLTIPVDRDTLEAWSQLSAESKANGWNVSDNDLWIAATSLSRGLPLATCDGDQRRIVASGLEVIFLAATPGPQG